MDTLCQIQKDFFLKDGKINYCTLEMVAKQCGLHVSTISRAINQKSFEYNDKYYPIKQLFSHSGLKEISAYTIKEKMKEIIESEDKAHPYSDEAIRKLLPKRISIFPVVQSRNIANSFSTSVHKSAKARNKKTLCIDKVHNDTNLYYEWFVQFPFVVDPIAGSQKESDL